MLIFDKDVDTDSSVWECGIDLGFDVPSTFHETSDARSGRKNAYLMR
jgi:hypothetical protein